MWTTIWCYIISKLFLFQKPHLNQCHQLNLLTFLAFQALFFQKTIILVTNIAIKILLLVKIIDLIYNLCNFGLLFVYLEWWHTQIFLPSTAPEACLVSAFSIEAKSKILIENAQCWTFCLQQGLNFKWFPSLDLVQ